VAGSRVQSIDRQDLPPPGRADPSSPVTGVGRQVLGLLGWLALTGAAAALGARASADAPDFYAQLVRPPWAPPAEVFGPVWTVLYLLMACAAWLVWRRHGLRGAGGAARTALGLFVLQLGVNALWSWLFFGWHLGAWAFVDVVLLWVLVAATWQAMRRLDRLAGALLVPYLLWVTFAAFLTFAVWRLNPTLLG